MPLPNYFASKPKPVSLSEITGGLSSDRILFEIEQGAKFVVYQYVMSALVITLRRNSKIYYLRPGESLVAKGLPYIIITALIGWWGVPFGLLYTPVAVYRNLRGGTDITPSVLSKLTADTPS
jgi:hypothetical protein